LMALLEHAADRYDGEHEEGGHERQVWRDAEDAPVGAVGDERLLEEQLHAVGECLEDPPRPRAVRPDAVLHVADDLALEPDHQHRRDQQEHEHDDDLEEHDDDDADRQPGAEERVHYGVSTRISVTGARASISTLGRASSWPHTRAAAPRGTAVEAWASRCVLARAEVTLTAPPSATPRRSRS